MESVTAPTEGELPILRKWLEKREDHPLRWYFQGCRDTPRQPNAVYAWWRNPILVAMEETLTILEAAQPGGLDGKRRVFRAFKITGSDYMDQFMRLRAELIIASLLAEASISFRFNTEQKGPGPDLLFGEDGRVFGIEVSSIRPKSLSDLSRTLHLGLRARGLPSSVSISTDPIPPVAIRDNVRNTIIDKFLPINGGPGVTSLRVMAAPARPEYRIPASWVTIRVGGGEGRRITTAPRNSPHMIATAQHVAQSVLREERKLRQAQRYPTVLIVDLSGTDLPDLRSWSQAFEGVWESSDDFLAVGAMVAHSVRREPSLSFSINPFVDQRLVEEVAARVAAPLPFADLKKQLARNPQQRRVDADPECTRFSATPPPEVAVRPHAALPPGLGVQTPTHACRGQSVSVELGVGTAGRPVPHGSGLQRHLGPGTPPLPVCGPRLPRRAAISSRGSGLNLRCAAVHRFPRQFGRTVPRNPRSSGKPRPDGQTAHRAARLGCETTPPTLATWGVPGGGVPWPRAAGVVPAGPCSTPDCFDHVGHPQFRVQRWRVCGIW